MNKEKECNICPNNCNILRSEKKGYCLSSNKIKVALVSVHKFEEPCISTNKGSGTIFFSHCNLRCEYCQNYNISQKGFGKEITIKRLADIFIEQQKRKVANINLVSPTIYAYKIKKAIIMAKNKGLSIPVIYNTNGFDKVETLEDMRDVVDVYLPDFKYASNELGKKYSKVDNYFDNVTTALKEMKRQKEKNIFDSDGTIKSGVIIRHLILPGETKNSKDVLKWIKENLGSDQYISLMAQYFPTYNAKKYKNLSRKITKEELKEVEDYMYELGFCNGYTQELNSAKEEYVPNFNLENV